MHSGNFSSLAFGHLAIGGLGAVSVNKQAFSWPRGRAGQYVAIGLGAVLALGAFAPVAARAATPKTLYVSQGGLDRGGCTKASPCATVSYALTKAPSGATIEVSGTIDDHPVISSPVTITTWPGGPAGSPAVLDGTASGSVVTVAADGVTLHDLTIENGALGVYNSEGTLTLTDRGIAVCPGTDQRGAARPGRGETGCTIGAAEAGFTGPTATSVTLEPAKVKAGTRVVYLAVVTPHPGTGTPTGTISFSTGSTSLCTAVLSGDVAACGATNAPAGTRTVTGAYSGGDGYAGSSGKATLTVTEP
jgi:hypothetical protein